jgi:hypothetical protein
MNCRTPSNWESDLALSTTHYPREAMTFAILYGSTASLEKEILKRLQYIGEDASHPSILPGILAELELKRHTRLVEKSINEVEARIEELNYHSANASSLTKNQMATRNELKRTSWLDLTYLRNSISTWTTQLQNIAAISYPHDVEKIGSMDETCTAKMTSDEESFPDCKDLQLPRYPAAESDEELSKNLSRADWTSTDAMRKIRIDAQVEIEGRCVGTPDSDKTCVDRLNTRLGCVDVGECDHDYHRRMMIVSGKIKNRLHAIIDNYDEKIRDCTMRVDGMAMATQWVNLPPLPNHASLTIARRIARQQLRLH